MPVSSIYHGRQSWTTGAPSGKPDKVQNDRVQSSTSYHSETAAVETCISCFLMIPLPQKTRLHDKTDAFCQQNALTWRMRQGQVYSTIWTLITFYGSHFEKKYLKKEIVHIYLKGLEFQFQKKFNLTKCLKSLAENSIMTLLWSEKRARKLQEYSGTILHSPTGRLKRTAKGCFLYLNCVSNF